MIQRIQSIFLLIVSVAMFAMPFFPLWQINVESESRNLIITAFYSLDKVEGQEAVFTPFPYAIIGFIAILAGMVAVIELFKYKNRLTQIKLGALNALLISATLVVSMFLILGANKPYAPEIYGTYYPAIYFPVVALVFNLLANRFIRRDEKLVRSVDRLR